MAPVAPALNDATPMTSEVIDTGLALLPTGNEVLASTLLFWLACFAANAIGQPSGRVCGLTYHRRAILRSSPIISFFDAILVLVLWVQNTYAEPTMIFKSATQILEFRLPDMSGMPDQKAIASLQSHTATRWVMFVITVLPQYAKLFASTGSSLILAQVFGAMFLMSWLTVELLIVASWIDAAIEAWLSGMQMKSSQVLNQVLRQGLESKITTTIAVFGILTHAFVYTACLAYFDFAVYPELLRKSLRQRSPGLESTFQIIQVYGLLCIVETWTAIAIGLNGVTAVRAWLRLRNDGKRWWRIITSKYARAMLQVVEGTLTLVCNGFSFYIHMESGRRSGMPSLVAALSCGKSTVPLICAILVPTMYCVNFYDPAGTYSPSWTEWLG